MNWPLPHMIMQQTGFIVQSEVQCLFVMVMPRSAELRFGRVRRQSLVRADSEIGAPQMGGTAARSIQLHHSHLLE